MPNDFFSFKEFTVHQDKCAMKVCTDACLFGAWLANIFQKDLPKNILDIGTGTGLLSLMLAQKNDAVIDAIEIDEAASIQAQQNFEASPWKERLNIFHTSIQKFSPEKKYDLIISNPPFFEGDLKSNDEKRNAALHDAALTLNELLENIERLLSPKGYFAVLLSFNRTEYFEKIAAEKKFFLIEQMFVKQTEMHSHFRSMLIFSVQRDQFNFSGIEIKNAENQYTQVFVNLLKDYYLYL